MRVMDENKLFSVWRCTYDLLQALLMESFKLLLLVCCPEHDDDACRRVHFSVNDDSVDSKFTDNFMFILDMVILREAYNDDANLV